jgi:GT2 family glycosyltransferase
MIAAEFPEVALLRGDGNLWWTRAINMGVEYALTQGADYIITLNDDIILHDNFIEEMISKAAENPGALLGGLEIDSSTKTPIYGGKLIDWKRAKYNSVLDTLSSADRHGLHAVNHLPGRELLIPAEVFHKIGLFDAKNFPQTIADYDFTYRAYKAGYRVYCNYDAQIEVYSDTQGGMEYRELKSWRNYRKHLFSIKGKANLNRFLRFGLKNCPRQYLVTFLLIGVSRRIGGYLFEWVYDGVRRRTPSQLHSKS